MRKKWQLFRATDFQSLMDPCFTFCQILGVFPYKITALTFEISKPHYILSTIVICLQLISLLIILYIINIFERDFKGIPRALERNCFYILTSFVAIVTYILSGSRMRLLQTIKEISSKLPPESYRKLSRLIHIKDILGFVYLLCEIPIYHQMNVSVVIKILMTYIMLLIFQMDMLYMNCVCVLKACFKRIDDSLEHIRQIIMENEMNHHNEMSYKQRSLFLLIKLKALKKQHLMIIDTVQMLNMTFSLQLLATVVITFIEITFKFYFYILYWQKGVSMIPMDDSIYFTFLTINTIFYFSKITLMAWACETGKEQAQLIGTTVHDVLNNTSDNEIKSELQSFSLQILHNKVKFSAKGLTIDATLLTAMMGTISTYLLILVQFLNMSNFCNKEIVINMTQITQHNKNII
ncbi:hypothetical protein P5V15_009549 [Pogonomyrmex californicus]